MDTVKNKNRDLWRAKEILYHRCPTCNKHLPWQKRHNTLILTTSCCGFIWEASPLHEATAFHVRIGQADMTNVSTISILG